MPCPCPRVMSHFSTPANSVEGPLDWWLLHTGHNRVAMVPSGSGIDSTLAHRTNKAREAQQRIGQGLKLASVQADQSVDHLKRTEFSVHCLPYPGPKP